MYRGKGRRNPTEHSRLLLSLIGATNEARGNIRRSTKKRAQKVTGQRRYRAGVLNDKLEDYQRNIGEILNQIFLQRCITTQQKLEVIICLPKPKAA
jgi:Holliday junction resolvase RusA-like endonuclease